MFNPMQLMSMLQGSANPMGMMQQMLSNNPMFSQAMKMAQGRDPNEIMQVINNVAQQKGIPPEQIQQMMQQFGIKR